VLSLRSPVFKAQLQGAMAPPLDAVPVPAEMTLDTLRRMLRFIYTDHIVLASAEEAQHLLIAADHYSLPRLRSARRAKAGDREPALKLPPHTCWKRSSSPSASSRTRLRARSSACTS
jgi:hypothetical protein